MGEKLGEIEGEEAIFINILYEKKTDFNTRKK